MHRHTFIMLITSAVLTWACDSPPPATRPREGAPPPPAGTLHGQSPIGNQQPDGAPTSAQQAAQGHWLRNHQLAEMWSGPADEPTAVTFGTTSSQLCVFEERDARGDRLYVFNPYSENYFWIERAAVGPAGTPEMRPRSAKPADQNCADAVFNG